MHRNVIELSPQLVAALQQLEQRQLDMLNGFIMGADLPGSWAPIENFTKLVRIDGTHQQAPAETTS